MFGSTSVKLSQDQVNAAILDAEDMDELRSIIVTLEVDDEDGFEAIRSQVEHYTNLDMALAEVKEQYGVEAPLVEVALETALVEALSGYNGDFLEVQGYEVASVRTFEDAGVLSRDRGLVIRFVSGHEVQLSMVVSDRGY